MARTKYKKATLTRGNGFGQTTDKVRRSTLEQGRALVGITPDDPADTRQVQWTYSVPLEDTVEPVLLTSYPSSNTTGWLLNRLGQHFRENGWETLTEQGATELRGFLGEGGVLPLRARLLTEKEAVRSRQQYTCQADERLPVVLVTLPDPAGYFPEESECLSVVAYSEAMLLEGLSAEAGE